jgi:hypothetical protein
MRRPRISIGVLMAIVVVVAADFAAIRSLLTSNTSVQIRTLTGNSMNPVVTSVDPTVFALGVLPMASILMFCVLVNLRRLLGPRATSSFLFGFELCGWASVFLFIALSALATSMVIDSFNALLEQLGPPIQAYLEGSPDWVLSLIGLSFVSVFFSLPELVFALCGGWLTSKLGITITIQRRRMNDPEQNLSQA